MENMMYAKKGSIVFAVTCDSDRHVSDTLLGVFSDKEPAWQCVQEWATAYERSIYIAGGLISGEEIGSLTNSSLPTDSPFNYFAIEYTDADNTEHYFCIEIRTKMVQ